MKRKSILAALAALLALVFAFALAGCSESTVSSRMVIYDDLSGTKTVTVRVWGDQEPLDGRDYTAGNNTSFMMTQGEALAEKLHEFCALDDVEISVMMGRTVTSSTYITLKFDFEDIDDYNAKAKVMAGKNAELWVDATLTENADGTVTVREAASNLEVLYLDILEQYFNDFDCYPVYEYGPNTQSQYIPNGIIFQGEDMYSFTWWVVPTAMELTVGSESAEETFFDPAEDYEYRADLSEVFLEVTGTPAARPSLTGIEVKAGLLTRYEEGEDFAGGVLTLTYSDGSTEEIAITSAMLTGFDTSTAGEKQVTVQYQGFEDTFTVTVAEGSTGPVDPSGPDDPADGPDDTPSHETPAEEGGFPVWAWFAIGAVLLLIVGGGTAVAMWRKEMRKRK